MLRAESDSASAAATEIQADESLYVQTFGSTAPAPASLAAALSIAGAWSSVVGQVGLWLEWAKEQEEGAWAHTFALTDSLRPMFESAIGSNASIRTAFTAIAKYFAARHAVGVYAAGQRKAKAKAKANPATPQAAQASAVPAECDNQQERRRSPAPSAVPKIGS